MVVKVGVADGAEHIGNHGHVGNPHIGMATPSPPQAPYWLPISRLDLHHKGFQRASASIGIRCQTLN